jgi:hypothetical protein
MDGTMADYTRQAKQSELEASQSAELIKFDRALQELERLGAKRIEDLSMLIKDFEIEVLKSIVFDLETAQARFLDADRQLKRL